MNKIPNIGNAIDKPIEKICPVTITICSTKLAENENVKPIGKLLKLLNLLL